MSSMTKLRVPYYTWKQVAQAHPSWSTYELQDGELRNVWTGNREYIYESLIDADDRVDYDSNFPSPTTVVNEDDAVAQIVGLTTVPKPAPVQSNGVVQVAVVGREGSEYVIATHDFTDKTTWYTTSVRVTDEAATDEGVGITWDLANANIIDISHGKLLDEDNKVVPLESHGYAVEVKVDSVVQTMRDPFALDFSGGGDYYVDYDNGKIVFDVSQSGKTVEVSYSYAVDSEWHLKPSAGQILTIEAAEAQFSADVVFDDGIVFELRGLVEVFAPHLLTTATPPGPYPPGTLIPLQTREYKTFSQLVSEAVGAYPLVPAITSTTGRGISSPIYGFPFKYATKTDLVDSYGMLLVVKLKTNSVLVGDHATCTFYCISNSE